MGKLADSIEVFLQTNPSKAALVAQATALEVPPSLRRSSQTCIHALTRIMENEREHDTIARVARAAGQKGSFTQRDVPRELLVKAALAATPGGLTFEELQQALGVKTWEVTAFTFDLDELVKLGQIERCGGRYFGVG